MSDRQRRQRPVLMGELPSLPATSWVPEMLRDFGPRTLSRTELDAARRTFVYQALDRKFARERLARRNGDYRDARYATAEELLAPLIEILSELPRRPDYSQLELERIIDARASHIFAAASTRIEHYARGKMEPMERPREAIDALKTLRTAARKLGPLAEQTLDLAGELLKLDGYLEGGPSLIPNSYLLVDKIDAAIEALRPQVSKGRRQPGGNRPRGARMADVAARAYAEITSELPPTTNPDHPHSTREPSYHRLVRRIFEHYGQRNWKECAKKAAERLHEIGRHRHLRTAPPGRPPRAATAKRGVE